MRKGRSPVTVLLGRLGLASSTFRWRIRCRDRDNRRSELLVQLGRHGVEVHCVRPGPLVLELLDVGRLRIALREAALAYSELRGTDHRQRADEESAVPPLAS